MFEINGKIAIVTGGCSGIGLSTVKALLQKGANVIISDINQEQLVKESAKLTNEYPMQVAHKVTDVSNAKQVEELVEFAVETFGKLDIMVANAGIGYGGSVLDDDNVEKYHKLIDVNQHGVFYSDSYAIKQMVEQGHGGVVINTSSIEGLIGDPTLPYYNASKGAVRLLTKSLALAHAKDNIRVSSVHPGYITTGMVNENTMGKEGIAYLESLHPLTKGIGRLGLPEEIAHGIIFAIENTFVTGTEIVIDGGYTAQ